MKIDYKPLWTNSVSSSIRFGGRLFESKKGYLKIGDSLRIVNHSGYVKPPDNWIGTEFEPFARAYSRLKGGDKATANATKFDWLSKNIELEITKIYQDGTYSGDLRMGSRDDGSTPPDISQINTLLENATSGGEPITNYGGEVIMNASSGVFFNITTSSTFTDTSVAPGSGNDSSWVIACGYSDFTNIDISLGSIFAPYFGNFTGGSMGASFIEGYNKMCGNGTFNQTLTPASHLAILTNSTNYPGGLTGGQVSQITNFLKDYNPVYENTNALHNTTFMVDSSNISQQNGMIYYNHDPDNIDSYLNLAINSFKGGMILNEIEFSNMNPSTTYNLGVDFTQIENFGYDCDIANNGSVDPEVNMTNQTLPLKIYKKHTAPYTDLEDNVGAMFVSNGHTEPIYVFHSSLPPCSNLTFLPSTDTIGTQATSQPQLILNDNIVMGTSVDQNAPAGGSQSETFSIDHTYFVDVSDGAGLCKPKLTGGVWPEDVVDSASAEMTIIQNFFMGSGSIENFSTMANYPFKALVENSLPYVTSDEEDIDVMNPLEVTLPAPSSSVQTDSDDLNISFITKTPHTNLPTGTIKLYLKNDTLGINEHLTDEVVTTAQTYNVTIPGATFISAYNSGPFPAHSDYYLQIESVSGVNGAFSRGYYFSIRANITEIDILSPTSGQDFNQGESVTITWEAQNNLTDTSDPQ